MLIRSDVTQDRKAGLLVSLVFAFALILPLAGLCLEARAATISFEETLRFTGEEGYISELMGQEGSGLKYFSFTHDISDQVGFGTSITEAFLELTFYDDDKDSVKTGQGSEINFPWFYEYAWVGIAVSNDFTQWYSLGEVDTGAGIVTLDTDWLNDDGKLDVIVRVDNNQSSSIGDVYLTSSTLSGEANQALSIARYVPPPPSVPEPASMLLFGSGLAGLAWYRRRKKA
jgi:hypothetical protein